MPTSDVVVVGGGPAGAAAAIALVRHGRDVVVVDRATFPRDKICGDGLTAGALRLLEQLGLDPASVPSWTPVDDVVVRSPSGHEVVFPLPQGAGSYAVVGPVASVIPVDVYVTGCPPAPAEILRGILAALGRVPARRETA